MKVETNITGKCYDTDSSVYIVNPLQIWKYLANDAIPLDILPGEDNKLVVVFDKHDTYQLYDAWCKREL